jgi:hypothetical protein
MSSGEPGLYPLLESLLKIKGLSLKAIYKMRDAAKLFDVSTRTLQDWVRDDKLRARDLPGRGRFLPSDLETFLECSLKRSQAPNDIGSAGESQTKIKLQGNRRQQRDISRNCANLPIESTFFAIALVAA